MNDQNKNSNADTKKSSLNRIWRLAKDVVITPVEELPQESLKKILPDGIIPKGRFGIQRQKVRSFPKIVNKDVIDVLTAFGEDGASYNDVLEHFVKLRDLDRKELHAGLQKLVNVLIHSSLLVDGGDHEISSAESVTPSFNEGDRWLDYTIRKNVHCLIDSEIYKIEHINTGELRALKIIQSKFPHKEMREKIIQRLNHEFKVIKSIDHPNVVKLFEYGAHQGRTYGILDWVDGPAVVNYAYDSGEQLDDKQLMNLALQCVEALKAVHDIGCLHGDVHTANYLTKEGHVCLIDFGLSRPIEVKKGEESKYSEGGVILYMPPEFVRKQFNKEPGLWGSVAGEIYSCGVILYSLFTRRFPYKWKFYKEDYMKSILNEPPLSFEESDRALWPQLEKVLHRALSKNPEDRFSSMAEFLQALKSVPFPEPADSDSSREKMVDSLADRGD